MDEIAKISIGLTFVGLLTLIVGYSRREARFGPLMIWAGCTFMILAVVYYILKTIAL